MIQSLYDETILVDIVNGFIYKKGYSVSKRGEQLMDVPTYKLNGSKKEGYVYYTLNKKTKRLFISEHRLVMSAHLNRLLDNSEIVDHINNVRDDNRICNLRIATRSENTKNSSKVYSLRKEMNNFTDLEIQTEIFVSLSDFFPQFNSRKNEHLVSNLGRLKFFNRRKKQWIIKNPYLTSSEQTYPFYDFNLPEFGRINIKVHVMVAKCFLSEKPFGDYVIDHIDNDQTNNRVTNLRYITRKENTQIAFKYNQYNIQTQTQPMSKNYTKDNINEILSLFYIENKTIVFLQKKFNHNRIFQILKGNTYKNLIDDKWIPYIESFNEIKQFNAKLSSINSEKKHLEVQIINIKTDEVYQSITQLVNSGLVSIGGFSKYLKRLKSGKDVSNSKYSHYIYKNV